MPYIKARVIDAAEVLLAPKKAKEARNTEKQSKARRSKSNPPPFPPFLLYQLRTQYETKKRVRISENVSVGLLSLEGKSSEDGWNTETEGLISYIDIEDSYPPTIHPNRASKGEGGGPK